MVSFTSISNGIKLCLLVSSFVYTVSGAPAASSDAATHTTTDNSSDFTLPSVISGRAKVPSFSTPDLSIEQDSIDKNNDWVSAQNSTSSSKRKRDSLVAGLFMDLPSIYPPIVPTHDANTKTPSASEISTITKYAELASTPYCRTVVPLGAWDCANCLSSVPDGVLVNTFSSLIDDTNGFILRSDKDKVIYLAFRGTNSIRSAIVDLEFNFANYPSVSGAKVHSGFLDSYKSVISDFFPVLQAQLTAHPSYKVIITGHSLGGAQAVLAGMDLYLREPRLGPDNMSIYTYGCPRVGNPTFAYFADGTGISHTRAVHKRDIVPHLPPMSFGFLHQGVESWIITDPNTVQTCTPDIEIDECADSIVPFTSFTDHLTYFATNEGLCA